MASSSEPEQMASDAQLLPEKKLVVARPPDEPVHLLCKERHADTLVIEWKVDDTLEAFFESCDLELGGWSWHLPTFGEGGEPHLVMDDLWSATLVGLTGDTVYDVRIRGRNSFGDGPWTMEQFRTSGAPARPYEMILTERGLEHLSLEWKVKDADGEPVTRCELQVAGALSWADAIYLVGQEPRRKHDEVWCATIINLASHTKYTIRARGNDAVGSSEWSDQYDFMTSGPPSAPFALRPVQLFPFMINLEWELPDPEGAPVEVCKIQVATAFSWQDPSYETKAHRYNENCWRATIAKLESQTTYDIRICGSNSAGTGGWTQGAFKTSSAPAAPFNFINKERHADNLVLQWQVADPEGAAVTYCDVEYKGMMSWRGASFAINRDPRRIGEDKWECDITHLASNTNYDFRVRGCNVAGEGVWAEADEVTSSEPPQAPYDIQTVYQRPNSVSLEWLIDDPDGAEVKTCEAQVVSGLGLSWVNVIFADGKAPHRVENTKWEGVIPDLCPNATYGIRIRGRNAAGDGLWKQQQIQTTHSPLPPHDIICSSPFPGALSVAWRVVDGRFSSVDRCEIEVSGALSWFPAVYNADAEPQRVQGHQWSACLIDLTPGAACGIRIRAGNQAGYSGWQTADSEVLGTPAPPTVVRQSEWALAKLVLEWEIANDADEIFGYEVQVSRGLFWEDAVYEDENTAPKLFEGTLWRATLLEMDETSVQSIRIRGNNRAGPGPWSDTIQFMIESELAKSSAFCCVRTTPGMEGMTPDFESTTPVVEIN